ncbi:MAG: guanylate kinase [Desulfobacteraceae bacterium]|jgi:guanylate kinase
MTTDQTPPEHRGDLPLNPRRGRLFILSAPSGAGKTTLCQALRERFPDLKYSVSSTTRPPRQGERDGVDYFFVTREDFYNRLEKGGWAEWAEVYGNFYGTSAAFLDRALAAGEDVLLDIDVQGTRQILRMYPDCVTVFIMPPSLEVLRERLEKRGTDSPEVIAKRLVSAREEMAQKSLYRYVVVNDHLPDTLAELTRLVAAEAHR